jgi:hypothetical protein
MYAKTSIDAIERIIQSMPKLTEMERYSAFATVKVLGAELDGYATSHALPHGSIRTFLLDVYEAARALASLCDRGERDDSYFILWGSNTPQLAALNCEREQVHP